MGAIGLPGASPRMREISLFVTFFCFFSFFRFFTSPTGRHSGPIFTIYTSYDALSLKEVPFGGLDDEFSHLLPFHLLPCCHEYCTKQGVFDVKQFADVIEIYARPIPVAMATKIWEF